MPGSACSADFTFHDPSHTFVPHRELQLSLRCQGSHALPRLTFRDPSHTFVPHREVQLSLRCQGPHASPRLTFRDRSHTFVPHREVQLSLRCQGSHASPCFVFRDPSHRGPTKPHVLEHPSPFLPVKHKVFGRQLRITKVTTVLRLGPPGGQK